MNIQNSDLKSSMNLHSSLNIAKLKKVNTKEDSQKPNSNLLNQNQQQPIEKLGKTAQKLEELNKQKVTMSSLENTVSELKQESDSKPQKGEIVETNNEQKKSKKNEEETKGQIVNASKKNKIFDPRDKNRDGKVSEQEKLEYKMKNENLEQKTERLVGDLISELKKDEDFKEINQNQFKGITKMINEEVINTKESSKLNEFLKS